MGRPPSCLEDSARRRPHSDRERHVVDDAVAERDVAFDPHDAVRRARASPVHRPPARRANVRRSVVMRAVGSAGSESSNTARPSGGTEIAASIRGVPSTTNTTTLPGGAPAFFPTT